MTLQAGYTIAALSMFGLTCMAFIAVHVATYKPNGQPSENALFDFVSSVGG